MIRFFTETKFNLLNKRVLKGWIKSTIQNENKKAGEINFIFCDDDYLLKINQEYLKHDYYTDVISFDNSIEDVISGEIFISIDMVKDNAKKLSIPFDEELKRVIIHGVLHFIGYKDKTTSNKLEMKRKEDYYLSLHND